MPNLPHIHNSVALITGGAKRIGANVARYLHAHNFNIVIHYHHSHTEAQTLAAQLNGARKNSCVIIQANLENESDLKKLAENAIAAWGKLNALINNASGFYPTPFATATEAQWNNIMASNVKAPFFLAQAVANELKKNGGCIINMADIYASKPLAQHSIYSIAKAANVMLTKTLAQELAPQVRVNGIAPGAILWPAENNLSPQAQENIIAKIPLQKMGEPNDIAKTILFLINDAPYMTGQIITVDGGRNLTL
jgi:pteridine reductase